MTPEPQGLAVLSRDPALLLIRELLREAGVREAYIVGGTVRDLLMRGRLDTRDVDVAVPDDPIIAAEAVAKHLDGTFVPLDERTVRVVFPGAAIRWQLDVARYRGATIREDLALRDFTIDAMATPLAGGSPGELLDPTGGSADLAAGIVRHVYPDVFRDDPLRTLRAVRLAAGLEGRIAPETRALIRQGAAGLARVAGERIRDEVARIFAARDTVRWAQELDDLGILPVLVPATAAMKDVPASPPHRFGLWEHSLEVLRFMESLLVEPGRWFPEDAEELARHTGEVVEGEIPRRALLALFALLHDVGKPGTRAVGPDGGVRFLGHEEAGAALLAELAARLRLGRSAGEYMDRMERAHMRPIWLASEPAVTPRARYRFFRDVGPVALDVLLHSVADVRATVGEDDPACRSHLTFVREMLAFRRDRPRPIERAALLSGTDVMEILGIGPGPLVGYILERLAEAAAVGPLRSRVECEALVRREFALWRQEFDLGGDR